MKTSNNTPSSSGIGFPGVLAVVFIMLKLIGVIRWSWWWVLSPLWIGWTAILLIVGAIALIAYWINK